jgi:hypothetical protein
VAERRLAIRLRREHAPAVGGGEGLVVEERGDDVAAAEPRRDRRHRQRCVLSEHGRKRTDVVALPRIDVLLDDLAQTVVAERRQRRLLRPRR